MSRRYSSSSGKSGLGTQGTEGLSATSSHKIEVPVEFTGGKSGGIDKGIDGVNGMDTGIDNDNGIDTGIDNEYGIKIDIDNDFVDVNVDADYTLRKLETCQTAHSQRSGCYSIKEIYGDLASDEIQLRRAHSRRSIISQLVDRTKRLHSCGDSYSDNASDNASYSSASSTISAKTTISNDLEAQKNDTTINKSTNTWHQVDLLPDTAVPIDHNGQEFVKIDPELISWDGPNDPEDPRNWPVALKCWLVAFVSIYTLLSPMSSSMPSPAIENIAADFGIESTVVSALVISIQILAWAVGPLVIAPLSEYDRIGRKVVLDVSIWMSLFFNIGCAFSQNTAQIIVFRFVGGLFGSSPLNVGAGVIADLFDASSRNTALAGFSLAPLLGPVIAPVVAGFIVEKMDWRWVFHVLSIFNGTVAILGTLFYRETYAPKLLKVKAARLRREMGNNNLHTIYELTTANESVWSKLRVTMTRPLHLLCTNPMIIGLGSFMAFTYGFMYLMIVTFPTIFEHGYGFSKGITGLMYIPMGIGFVVGVLFWTVMINIIYTHLTTQNHGIPKPEFRLPCLMFSGVGIAIGLFWYGWSVQHQLHWIMPAIGSAIFAFSFIAVFQTIQNYLIDMNPVTLASSVASAAVFRSLLGFSMPLVAHPLYKKLTYGWGNTMFGFIALLLGIPFPVFCYHYGERLRTWANHRMELHQLNRDRANLEKLQNLGKLP